MPDKISIGRALKALQTPRPRLVVDGAGDGYNTPVRASEGPLTVIGKISPAHWYDEVDPLWSTEEGKALWERLPRLNPRTVTKDRISGQTQAHGEHGHFASGGGGGGSGSTKEPEWLSTIRSRTGDFYTKPGVSIRDLSSAHVADRMEMKRVGDEFFAIAQERLNANGGEANRSITGLMYVTFAMQGAGLELPIYHVMTAHDEEGRLHAALGYEIDDAHGFIRIGYLGSTRSLYGAATALEYELSKIAAAKDYRITSVATGDSAPFHRQIGRTVRENQWGEQVSSWSAARVKQIAALNLEGVPAAGSKMAVGVAVRKDRISGADQPHGEHGRFVSGGVGASPELEHDAARYAEAHGIFRPSINYDDIRVDPERSKTMAAAYKALPSVDESARVAYRQLAEETRQQYEYLTKTMGITVEVTTEDPYKNAREMRDDVLNNRHIFVLAAGDTGGAGSHPFVSADEIQMFRAVHDVFGHAATGRDFDRHGEEAAWASHSGMYSPLARQAMTTATRGQNSVLTQDGTGFPEQKGALLPDEYVDIANVTHVSKRVVTTEQRHCFGGGRAQYDLVRRGVEAPTVTKDRISGASQAHGEHGHFASGGGGRQVSNDELKAVYQDSAIRLEGNDLFLPQHLKASVSGLVAGRMLSTTEEMQHFVADNFNRFRDNITVYEARGGTVDEPDVKFRYASSPVMLAEVERMESVINTPSSWLAVQSDGAGGMRIIIPSDTGRGLGQGLSESVTLEEIGNEFFSAYGHTNLDDEIFKPTDADGELVGEAADLFRSAVTSQLIGAWAGSANDNLLSDALQTAAERTFRLGDAAPPFTDLGGEVQQSPVLDDFLQTEHALTQEAFAAAGFSPDDTVTLVRGEDIYTEFGLAPNGYAAGGSVGAAGNGIPVDEETYREPAVWQADAQLRPLSSWSWSKESAASFGDHRLVSTFKIDDIVSFSSTGSGCHNENEFIVKGGTVEVDVHQSGGTIQLALDADLTKDKESARSQAHGEHGHFASGSSGPTLDAKAINTVNDRQMDGPIRAACERLGYRATDYSFVGEEWRTTAATAKFGVAINLQEAMQSSTAELVRVGQPRFVSVLMVEKEEVDSPTPHYRTKAALSGVTMNEAEGMSVEPGLYIRASATGSLYGVRFNESTDPEEFFRALGGPLYLDGPRVSDLYDSVSTGTRFFAMGTPEADDLIRGAAVSHFISGWASTTNDESLQAHTVQDVAKDHFGVDDAAPWLDDEAGIDQSDIDKLAAENGDVYRDLLSTMFDQTQQAFSDAGYSPTDTVTLYRGEQGMPFLGNGSMEMLSSLGTTPADDWLAGGEMIYEPGPADATLRPLSSWANDQEQADQFAGYRTNGLVMESTVAVQDILSTWTSGFGCMRETEVVITGGERKVEVIPNSTFRSIDPSVTKDRESGKDQPHGYHGWFTSGGVGEGEREVPGSTLRAITSTPLNRDGTRMSEGTRGFTVMSSQGPITIVIHSDIPDSQVPSRLQCQTALSTLADLHETYGKPGQDELPDIHVVPLHTAVEDGAGLDAEAYVIPFQPTINLEVDQSGTIHLVEDRPFREYDVQGLHAGRFSPAIEDVIQREPMGAVKYIVAHEYGHVENADNRFTLGRTSLYTTFDRVKAEGVSGMSRQAQENAQECYAEQFAEWAMTAGKPATDVAKVYGEVYGWA